MNAALEKFNKKNPGENKTLEQAVNDLVTFDFYTIKTLLNNNKLDKKKVKEAYELYTSLNARKLDLIIETLKYLPENLIMAVQEINKDTVTSLNDQFKNQNMPFKVISNIKQNTGFIVNSSLKYVTHNIVIDITEFNKNLCMISLNNIYYLSIHLTSKKKEDDAVKNYEIQYTKLIEFCEQYDNVVIMGDLNHKVYDKTKDFNFAYPNEQNDLHTCFKRRSALQVQFKKIDKLDKGTKDFILIKSKNLKVTAIDQRVSFLDKKFKNDEEKLPNFGHPTDHLLVQAIVNFESKS
jgi:hypothetical protein